LAAPNLWYTLAGRLPAVCMEIRVSVSKNKEHIEAKQKVLPSIVWRTFYICHSSLDFVINIYKSFIHQKIVSTHIKHRKQT